MPSIYIVICCPEPYEKLNFRIVGKNEHVNMVDGSTDPGVEAVDKWISSTIHRKNIIAGYHRMTVAGGKCKGRLLRLSELC